MALLMTQNSFWPSALLRPVSVLLVSAALIVGITGCTKPVLPLDQIVFGDNPTQDMRDNVASFKQLPKEDAEILLSYIVANDIQKMKGGTHASLSGKTVDQALQDARQWATVMKQFMQQSDAISQQIRSVVDVVPTEKLLNEASTHLGTTAHLITLRYRVINRSSDLVAGVRGQVRYWWPDGRPIGALEVAFSGPFKPGQSEPIEGSPPVLVGSNAPEAMREFARAQLGELRFDFRPTALVYQDGRVVKIPSF